jgi:hypothetical protein
MDCAVDAYIDCDAEMTGGCTVACEDEGVLECNGEFIDRKDLEAAIAWVEANMNAEVTFEGDAECEGNKCYAEGSCEASAGTVAASRPFLGVGSALLFCLAAGLLFVLRRRK